MVVGCAMCVVEARVSEAGESFPSNFTDLVHGTDWFLCMQLFTQQSNVI
jgi:hypothetical protein